MTDYAEEFVRLGQEDVVRGFYAKIKLPKLLETINASFCTKGMKDALKRMVTKRFKELEDVLS